MGRGKGGESPIEILLHSKQQDSVAAGTHHGPLAKKEAEKERVK